MKKTNLVLALVLLSVLAVSILASEAATNNGVPFNERKIVIFSSAINEPARDAITRGAGGVIEKQLPFIDGAVVILPDKASEKALASQAGVLRVEDDVRVKALGKPSNPGSNKPPKSDPPQTLEWNIDRVDAELAWSTSTGNGIKVAVIDTGIDKDHRDLTANLKGGVNFVLQKARIDPEMWDDDNGHGTHVAGIIAAANNTIGVVGVAPEAGLYAVKVLDRSGSGYVSDVIAGIQWAIDNDLDVINLSLGSDYDSLTLHDIVDLAYDSGITIVAAAGNDGDTDPDSDVDYPAAYASVIAVAATDISDQIYYYSSDGPEVELAAPGVNIYSCWKGGSYKAITGTSMASPHVAGTVAAILAAPVPAIYDTDLNNHLEPSEVRSLLIDTADDLGPAGFDNRFGNGLTDTEESVTGAETGI